MYVYVLYIYIYIMSTCVITHFSALSGISGIVYIVCIHTLKSCKDLKTVPSKRLFQLWNLVSIVPVDINLCKCHEHIGPGNHLLLSLSAFFIDKLDFGSLPSESLASQVEQAAQVEQQKPGPQPSDSQTRKSTSSRAGLP